MEDTSEKQELNIDEELELDQEKANLAMKTVESEHYE